MAGALGGLMGGGGGGGGGGSADIGPLLAQWIATAGQRIQQNASDLGLGPAGQNWTDPQGKWPASADAPPVFPAGTPFAGQIPGFPPGTPQGTLPTATSMDLNALQTQGMAGFAPAIDAQRSLNAQAQTNASGATGLLSGLTGGGSGLSGLGGLAGGL
jgi:hypothetical protein